MSIDADAPARPKRNYTRRNPPVPKADAPITRKAAPVEEAPGISGTILPRPAGFDNEPQQAPPAQSETRSTRPASAQPIDHTDRASALPEGVFDPDNPGEVLTRRNLEGGQGTIDFTFPPHRKRPDWDYEFKTSRVSAADVEGAEVASIYEGGWRPVPPREMPELCPPGWKKPYIERWGQIAYMRPMHLTEEARWEQIAKAERVKHDRLMAAQEVQTSKPGSIRARIIEGVQIEGVVGSHKQESVADRS